jgi:SUKH superfamily protein
MSFENLLFFGDAGNGDLFAYKVLGGRASNIDIFVWNHEDDSRTFIAGSLKNFLEYWLTGKLKI